METLQKTTEEVFNELFPRVIWRKDGKLTFPKNKTRYTKQELLYFKKILEGKKEEIEKRIHTASRENVRNEPFKPYQTESSGDSARELVMNHDITYLREIKHALERIDNGEYGRSRDGIIHPDRLRATPTTTQNIAQKLNGNIVKQRRFL